MAIRPLASTRSCLAGDSADLSSALSFVSPREPAALDWTGQRAEDDPMEHLGGCHCGTLRVQLRLTKPPAEMPIRSCACSFCRAHGTRTVSDPAGQADVWASDWSLVERYRFGSLTADYLLCRRCGVYVGAVCDTPAGRR